jgi:hypothetical protein
MGFFRTLLRGRRRAWPTGVPPTVPPTQQPAFHCPKCRRPAPDGDRVCASCGAHLLGDLG